MDEYHAWVGKYALKFIHLVLNKVGGQVVVEPDAWKFCVHDLVVGFGLFFYLGLDAQDSLAGGGGVSEWIKDAVYLEICVIGSRLGGGGEGGRTHTLHFSAIH